MIKLNWSLLGLLILIISGCSGNENKKLTNEVVAPRSVVIDAVFEARFMPDTIGFAGSDGVYSQILPDGRTVWIFGDTFIGNLIEGNKRVKTNPLYIRNSFVVFEGEERITLQQGEPKDFMSMMIPPEITNGSSKKNELELWYWPGDALVENQNLEVFVSKFSKTGDGMWDFKFEGTELIQFSLPDFKTQRSDHFDNLNEIHFGHAICETDSITYIYGLKEGKVYVAKTEAGDIRGSWKYFTGAQWSNSSSDARPMLDFSGSEQFSVFPYQNKFIMIMQEGDLSNKIFAFTADSPVGPWSKGICVYETPLPESNKNIFTYNALGHPQFIENGMLLVSYNTNSFELEDHFEDALIYRPRFIRVPMELIIKN